LFFSSCSSPLVLVVLLFSPLVASTDSPHAINIDSLISLSLMVPIHSLFTPILHHLLISLPAGKTSILNNFTKLYLQTTISSQKVTNRKISPKLIGTISRTHKPSYTFTRVGTPDHC
jgi:hypothetical protein